MSQTTVDTRADTKVRTVKLQNGDVFSFNSNISTELEKIPVIDASRIWSDKLEDRKAVAEEIRDASRNIGFFYLINHVSSLFFAPQSKLTEQPDRVSTKTMPLRLSIKPKDSSPYPRRRRWRCSPV
jgi:hypothetical protein